MRKILVAGIAVLVLAAVALVALRPWESGGDTQAALDESLPVTASATSTPDPTTPAPSAPASPAAAEETPLVPRPTKPTPSPKPKVTELAKGQFEDAEYATDGSARIVRLADGTRFLRIENFSTSQAPVIQVAFSAAPSGGEWGSYDDVRFAPIGTLKALSGNQNYEIPQGLDLSGFRSVVIWCDKYDVALGTAPVQL